MDRKSFFKRVLLGAAALVVPNAILKAHDSELIPEQKSDPRVFPYEDHNPSLFEQFRAFDMKNVVHSNTYYWAEYDSFGQLSIREGSLYKDDAGKVRVQWK